MKLSSDQGNNHHDYPLPFDNASLPNQTEYLGSEKQANYTNKLPLERIMHIHRAKSKYSTKKKESCPHKFSFLIYGNLWFAMLINPKHS